MIKEAKDLSIFPEASGEYSQGSVVVNSPRGSSSTRRTQDVLKPAIKLTLKTPPEIEWGDSYVTFDNE